MEKYIYVGEGVIPGMPQAITEEEIQSMPAGERAIVDELIKKGLYALDSKLEIKDEAPSKSKKSAAKTATPAVAEGE